MNINDDSVGCYGDTEHVPAIRNIVVRYSFMRGCETDRNLIFKGELTFMFENGNIYTSLLYGYGYVGFSFSFIKYILNNRLNLVAAMISPFQ